MSKVNQYIKNTLFKKRKFVRGLSFWKNHGYYLNKIIYYLTFSLTKAVLSTNWIHRKYMHVSFIFCKCKYLVITLAKGTVECVLCCTTVLW